jgi:hypothetical protein
MSYDSDFCRSDVRNALVDFLAALEHPTNAQRLEAARMEAGESMVKQMQVVFPIVAKIQVRKNETLTLTLIYISTSCKKL